MQISESRLNSPYNPAGDFLNGESIIVFGDTVHDPALQAAMIDSNLSRFEPTVRSIEDPQRIDHRYSKMEICKIAVGKILENKRLLTIVIATLAMSIISMTFWVLSARSLVNFYHKYKNGDLIRYIYRGIPGPVRPIILGDVVGEGLDLLMMNALPTAAFLILIFTSGSLIYKEINSLQHRKVVVRKITNLPSSGALLTCVVKDFFTGKQLSISEVKRPGKLTIGTDTGDVWKMINRVLSMEKVYAYPSKNVTMTSPEIEKLNSDIRNLFDIRDLSFFNYKFPKDRKEAFLKLLPSSTIHKYDLISLFGQKN